MQISSPLAAPWLLLTAACADLSAQGIKPETLADPWRVLGDGPEFARANRVTSDYLDAVRRRRPSGFQRQRAAISDRPRPAGVPTPGPAGDSCVVRRTPGAHAAQRPSFDLPDVAGLVAPRHLVLANLVDGRRQRVDRQSARSEYGQAQQVFSAFSSEDKLRVVDADTAEAVIQQLVAAL